MAASTTVARALQRALDVESVPLERPPRRPGPSWLFNPRRLEIVLTAAAYPGIHLRSASRLLLSPLPSLRFHIRRLEEQGLLESTRLEGRVHLFIPSTFPRTAEAFLASWQASSDRGILELIARIPGIKKSELGRRVSMSSSILESSIRRLVSRRAIVASRPRTDPRFRTTKGFQRFQASCEKDGEKRLRRFLAVLESDGLNPSLDAIERDRARISVDGPRSRIRFVLPLNPIVGTGTA